MRQDRIPKCIRIAKHAHIAESRIGISKVYLSLDKPDRQSGTFRSSVVHGAKKRPMRKKNYEAKVL